jgi:predicted benzoate:H+ symporter BenE
MTEYLSPFAADLIGFAGSFFIVAAFAYSNLTTNMNTLWFNVSNFVGAALLTVSLTVNYNLPTMVLEIVWMAIALFGIVKALRSQKQDADKRDDAT